RAELEGEQVDFTGPSYDPALFQPVGADRVTDDVRLPREPAPAIQNIIHPGIREEALAVVFAGSVEFDHGGARDRSDEGAVRAGEKIVQRGQFYHQPDFRPGEESDRVADDGILRLIVGKYADVEVQMAFADNHVGDGIDHGGEFLLRTGQLF